MRTKTKTFWLVVKLSPELHLFFWHVSMHPRTFWPLKVSTPHWESRFRSMQLRITNGSLVSSEKENVCKKTEIQELWSYQRFQSFWRNRCSSCSTVLQDQCQSPSPQCRTLGLVHRSQQWRFPPQPGFQAEHIQQAQWFHCTCVSWDHRSVYRYHWQSSRHNNSSSRLVVLVPPRWPQRPRKQEVQPSPRPWSRLLNREREVGFHG